MKNSFNISVKKPCTEKFKDFKTTANGGFCGACQKEVIDFTTMSELEIINYFSQNKAKTCGRFKTSQLKKYNTVHMHKPNNHYLPKTIGVFSFSLLSLCAISTQAQEVEIQQPTIETELNTVSNNTVIGKIVIEKHTVSGTVLDEENMPLPGVNVVLKGTETGAVTDIDGKFVFPIALEEKDTLIFSYIGYDTKEYIISKNESSNIDITIIFDSTDIELMGEIVVVGAYETKRNIFQKFIGLFK